MTLVSTKRIARSTIARDTGQSASNASQTVSTVDLSKIRRLFFVTVKYSSNVTVNVTVTLNSSEGAAWDTLLQTIVLTAAKDGVFIPDEALYILDNDVIDVLAPAGGADVTSTIAIYSELVW